MIASYFEWVQNIQQMPWNRETMLQRLEAQLEAAWDSVGSLRREKRLDLRTAAYEIAVERVLRAIELRGF